MGVFERFIVPLESELGSKSMHAVGMAHSTANVKDYNHRIEAINYTLSHDDGVTHRGLEEADIVLVGVSRSGKTPTCLYMAMQFGIKAANYPLIPEDLEANRLPQSLVPLKQKVWGLSIAPDRLQQIRKERRPDSKYASIENCRFEVADGQLEKHRRWQHFGLEAGGAGENENRAEFAEAPRPGDARRAEHAAARRGQGHQPHRVAARAP